MSFIRESRIDHATLTAYRLIAEPETLELYEQSDNTYQFIKGYIKKERKKDASQFPLAEPQLNFHDICSQFGSHADIAAFIHKIAVLDAEDPNQALMTVGMFQPPDSDDELRQYMVETLLAFTRMIQVFAEFIGSVTKNFDVIPWGTTIEDLIAACHGEAERLEEAIKGANDEQQTA